MDVKSLIIAILFVGIVFNLVGRASATEIEQGCMGPYIDELVSNDDCRYIYRPRVTLRR